MSEYERIKNVVASSLRADIANAARHIENEQGDRGYWERQIEKAQARLEELGHGRFDVGSYVLDMLEV